MASIERTSMTIRASEEHEADWILRLRRTGADGPEESEHLRCDDVLRRTLQH
jgi:hypothetical protein